MKKIEKIAGFVSRGVASAASLLKVALMSRRPSAKGAVKGEEFLIVMGNGPSLRDAIDNNFNVLQSHPLLSVNFSPNTDEFFILHPQIHVLADGLFFEKEKKGNVAQMWSNLGRVDWPMTLYVPATQKKNPDLAALPDSVEVKYFNLTPAEGWRKLTYWLYRRGLAMPRPRNVLIPSIMAAMREGYSRIALAGADHSWSRTLWVDEQNRVITVQPHFYKDNDKEHNRVADLYKDIHIHQIYESFAIAFRSYFNLRDYANSQGVEIVNSTQGSFIDAFPRIPLDKLD